MVETVIISGGLGTYRINRHKTHTHTHTHTQTPERWTVQPLIKGVTESYIRTREIREQIKMYLKGFSQKWNLKSSLDWPFQICVEQLTSYT